jgi:hypothetical protein
VEPDAIAVLFIDSAARSGAIRIIANRPDKGNRAEVEGFRILRCQSPAIPNAIAALLLYLRNATGIIPHAYFGWTEGNPIAYLLKFLVFGEADTAPVTPEVRRQTEDDPQREPRIHVG